MPDMSSGLTRSGEANDIDAVATLSNVVKPLFCRTTVETGPSGKFRQTSEGADRHELFVNQPWKNDDLPIEPIITRCIEAMKVCLPYPRGDILENLPD